MQRVLRDQFARWGRPQRFRVDNGAPWGSWSDLPPPLALWAIGLGVEMAWNPPGQPQHNGVVEKSQDTGQRWAEPERCATAEELQRRLDEMDAIQRAEYPSLRGHSRLEVYPALVHSGRPYSRGWEQRQWSLERLVGHLAGYAASRRVDSSGNVSVYDHNVYVGTRHRGAGVWVQLDPLERAWLITDAEGRQLRQQPCRFLQREQFLELPMTHG